MPSGHHKAVPLSNHPAQQLFPNTSPPNSVQPEYDSSRHHSVSSRPGHAPYQATPTCTVGSGGGVSPSPLSSVDAALVRAAEQQLSPQQASNQGPTALWDVAHQQQAISLSHQEPSSALAVTELQSDRVLSPSPPAVTKRQLDRVLSPSYHEEPSARAVTEQQPDRVLSPSYHEKPSAHAVTEQQHDSQSDQEPPGVAIQQSNQALSPNHDQGHRDWQPGALDQSDQEQPAWALSPNHDQVHRDRQPGALDQSDQEQPAWALSPNHNQVHRDWQPDTLDQSDQEQPAWALSPNRDQVPSVHGGRDWQRDTLGQGDHEVLPPTTAATTTTTWRPPISRKLLAAAELAHTYRKPARKYQLTVPIQLHPHRKGRPPKLNKHPHSFSPYPSPSSSVSATESSRRLSAAEEGSTASFPMSPPSRPLTPNGTEQLLVMKRKRGRPRIHPIAVAESLAVVQVKQKRGRPRVYPIAVAESPAVVQVKRKRGRPRVHSIAVAESPAVVQVKRKRGRPRVHPTTPPPVKRKRGRPRKVRLPGRPSNIEQVAEEEDGFGSAPLTISSSSTDDEAMHLPSRVGVAMHASPPDEDDDDDEGDDDVMVQEGVPVTSHCTASTPATATVPRPEATVSWASSSNNNGQQRNTKVAETLPRLYENVSSSPGVVVVTTTVSPSRPRLLVGERSAESAAQEGSFDTEAVKSALKNCDRSMLRELMTKMPGIIRAILEEQEEEEVVEEGEEGWEEEEEEEGGRGMSIEEVVSDSTVDTDTEYLSRESLHKLSTLKRRTSIT